MVVLMTCSWSYNFSRCCCYRTLGLWVLLSALQNANERCIEAKEVQLTGRSKRGQTSEYTWQATFGLLGRAVLLTQPRLAGCTMLAEVGVAHS